MNYLHDYIQLTTFFSIITSLSQYWNGYKPCKYRINTPLNITIKFQITQKLRGSFWLWSKYVYSIWKKIKMHLSLCLYTKQHISPWFFLLIFLHVLIHALPVSRKTRKRIISHFTDYRKYASIFLLSRITKDKQPTTWFINGELLWYIHNICMCTPSFFSSL